MELIVIDAENAVMGRISSFAAKKALLGNEIAVVNSEKAIITGTTENIVERYQKLRRMGADKFKGPYRSRDTEKMMKRCIRGMLPNYREGRGREAWKRIKCYNGIPEEFKDKKMIKLDKKLNTSFMTLAQLKTHLG